MVVLKNKKALASKRGNLSHSTHLNGGLLMGKYALRFRPILASVDHQRLVQAVCDPNMNTKTIQ